MDLIETSLAGCVLITLDRHKDQRGSFTRGFDHAAFKALGLPQQIDHTAEAMNLAAFTLRGLHFQLPQAPEPKLVRCLHGTIFDVVVDIRHGSNTFGHWQSVRLDADDQTALFIPSGFAHGYLTLTSSCLIAYHIFAPYRAEAQRGIIWNDPGLSINWPQPPHVISERDQQFPFLSDYSQHQLKFSEASFET